ncbi:MAG: asparagine synthase (glutamine-hydrolyzing) [Actinomycetota bacterium]
MCGICGILGTSDGFAVDEELVTTMRELIHHRGPDDGGSWHLPGQRVALAHRRLSIIDLSPAGHQPMSNEDGTVWLTFGGEIYNHMDIRPELEAKGHAYRSHTDTETIIHLYEEEGPRCVERLHGMFHYAIWDTRTRELHLARDRLGKKPIYYAQPDGGFVFGSEIKALLAHPSLTPELDEEAFFHYLTFVCTPAPMTMFKGIRKLGPAERMTVRADGSTEIETYWTPMSQAVSAEIAGLSEPELAERLLEILRESIRRRMMSDVPFGVFLSGGLDSSTNVALMSELMDEPVRTFSVGFDEHEHGRYNELPYARKIADLFGTDHHEVVIDSDDLESFLPQLIYQQDEPLADWVAVPLHYVSKLARDNDTVVVQIGEGSDELFHGYQSYISHARFQERYWPPFQRVPRPLRRGISRAANAFARRSGRGFAHAQAIEDAAEGRMPFWGGAIAYQGELKERVLSNGRPHPDSYAIVERLWRQAERDLPGADLLQKMTYLELKNRLAELLLMRVDKMTMLHGVETRVPFLDVDLVEFALALPPEMKVRDGSGKYLLKKAVGGLLPDEIVNRRKQGFSAPVSEWFREGLGERARKEIRESSLVERGLLDYQAIDDLWEAHRAGRGDWAFQLWNIYNVSAWHDRWVAGRVPTG